MEFLELKQSILHRLAAALFKVCTTEEQFSALARWTRRLVFLAMLSLVIFSNPSLAQGLTPNLLCSLAMKNDRYPELDKFIAIEGLIHVAEVIRERDQIPADEPVPLGMSIVIFMPGILDSVTGRVLSLFTDHEIEQIFSEHNIVFASLADRLILLVRRAMVLGVEGSMEEDIPGRFARLLAREDALGLTEEEIHRWSGYLFKGIKDSRSDNTKVSLWILGIPEVASYFNTTLRFQLPEGPLKPMDVFRVHPHTRMAFEPPKDYPGIPEYQLIELYAASDWKNDEDNFVRASSSHRYRLRMREEMPRLGVYVRDVTLREGYPTYELVARSGEELEFYQGLHQTLRGNPEPLIMALGISLQKFRDEFPSNAGFWDSDQTLLQIYQSLK